MINLNEPQDSAWELPAGLSDSHLRIYELAKPWLQTRNNDPHTRIAFGIVLELLDSESGDPEIAIPAILLHDVGWHFVSEDQQKGSFGPTGTNLKIVRIHEIKGAEKAKAILESLDYPAEMTEEICRIVGCHDSDLGYQTLEEAIVKDADKVSRASRTAFEFAEDYFPSFTKQHLHDRLLAEYPSWLFTRGAHMLANESLEERRLEYGLQPMS